MHCPSSAQVAPPPTGSGLPTFKAQPRRSGGAPLALVAFPRVLQVTASDSSLSLSTEADTAAPASGTGSPRLLKATALQFMRNGSQTFP